MSSLPLFVPYTIEDSGASLQITIYIKKQWAQILFLGFWLMFWTVGGVLSIWGFLTEKNSVCIVLFIAFWLIGWARGEAHAIDSLLWQFGGKEIIEISQQSIILWRPILGFRFPWKYQADNIENLRLFPLSYFDRSIWARHANFWELGGHLIAFDYKGKATRLIWGLTETEAKQVIAHIQQRFPQYG